MLSDDPSLGYRVVGLVDDYVDRRSSLEAGPLVGRVEEALDAIHRAGATGVIVATTGVEPAALNRLTRQLSEAGIHVELSSSLRDIAAKRLTVRNLGRFQVVHVDPVQRSGWRASAKRAFDMFGAAVGLLLLAPVVLAISVAIKVNRRSRGPILFRQERLGRDGVRFQMLKFRTMQVAAHDQLGDLRDQNHSSGPLFKLKNDPRVTPVGRVLRKFSLDELPQLWNVLRGEMSLVGPRPALPDEVLGWTPELHQRLAVLPGMTGMWQISGRSNSTFEEYTRLDLYYVDNWSLWTDLTILAKTVPAVLFRRGAY
jgi:exopolysaccharide biosynthesis polyprenyl glycosylphosphotransferase